MPFFGHPLLWPFHTLDSRHTWISCNLPREVAANQRKLIQAGSCTITTSQCPHLTSVIAAAAVLGISRKQIINASNFCGIISYDQEGTLLVPRSFCRDLANLLDENLINARIFLEHGSGMTITEDKLRFELDRMPPEMIETAFNRCLGHVRGYKVLHQVASLAGLPTPAEGMLLLQTAREKLANFVPIDPSSLAKTNCRQQPLAS